MKKAIVALLAISLISLASYSAAADECRQDNNLIGAMGPSSSDGTIYASVSGHNNNCGCDYFRFMPKNTDTKAVLSILIAAKMSGQRVVIWTNKVGDCNNAYMVFLQ